MAEIGGPLREEIAFVESVDGAVHTFELDLVGPLDVAASVERFRRWGDDLLDRWDGRTLIRTTPHEGAAVPYACTTVGSVGRPRLRVHVADAAHQPVAERALLRMFVTPPGDALERLIERDPAIERMKAAYPGIRPIVQTDGVAAIVRSISAQQVNLAWAATTRRRLAELVGEKHTFGPFEVYSLPVGRLAEASAAQLRALQFTTRKAEYIVDVARRIVTGALDLEALADMPDEEVVARLTTVRGIGRWTAEWYLARTLGRPVVVAGDLGVRKAVGAAYLEGTTPSEQQVRELTAHWGAAACVAQELALYALHRREQQAARG
jgi:DNA-3-methyladenine glycosylase II